MRRRAFLAVAGSSLATAAAGCTASIQDRTWIGHPFAGTTVTVRVDDRSDTDHDVAAIAREALAYWEDHSEAYAGFEVSFDVVAADDPDLVVEYVDDPDDCRDVEGYSEHVLGCAPIVRPGTRLRETVRAIVVAGARPYGKIRITTKHELGHVLGLGHDDEPQEIMSTRPELRIPMYDLRVEIWETVLDAHERVSDATRSFNDGVVAWDASNYEDAGTAFEAAADDYGAARRLFADARERADAFADDQRVETVDLAGLQRDLDRLVDRAILGEEVTASMIEAVAAAVTGDRREANEHVTAANEGIREFAEFPSPELRDVAIALGLVRGFDRDEPAADGGGDGIDE